MSDIKRSCPVCEAWTSEVGYAVRDGEPCPYCGTPADLILRIDALREAHGDRRLRQELETALVDMSKARQEADRLRDMLTRVQLALWPIMRELENTAPEEG